MNKSLTLLLAGIAIQASAADVSFNAAMSVNGNSFAEQKGTIGVTAGAEYEAQVSENAAAFASANVFVSPMSFQSGGPKNANFIVGGTFSQSGSPASAQFGVGLEVISPAEAEADIVVAPSFFYGSKWAVNDDISLTMRAMHSIPVTKQGEVDASVVTASFGIQKTVAVEA